MSDIQRGHTFSTNIPDAASLHQLADLATILPAFITGKSISAPASADSFVFAKNGALFRCTLAGLIAAFPNGGAGSVAALRKLGTIGGTAAAGNDSRFQSRVTGVRLGNGVSPDTAAKVKDLQFPGASLVGVTIIDWTAAEVFSDNLTGNKTYTFSNTSNGRRIMIAIRLNAFTASFPAILGTVPVLGSGTTCKTYYFNQSPIGITGFCVAS